MYRLTGNVYALDLGESYENYKEILRSVPGLRFSPKARRVEGSIDAVAAACCRIGVPLPSLPKCLDAGPDSLFKYQRVGVGWLLDNIKQHGAALLADDMGLGKTRQAIEVAKKLTESGGRVLIICPAFLRSNWVAELNKWGEKDVISLGPKTNKRTKDAWQLCKKAKWIVSSYDLASKAIPAAFQTNTPKFLIMDEAHYLKGRDVKRSKQLEDIANLSTYRLAITGSPQWSRPRDLFQLLRLLFGKRFGSSFEFDVAYAGGILNQWGGLDNKGATNPEELKLRLSYYMLRRLKTEVAQDLPDLMRNVVWVEPSQASTLSFHTALASRHAGATYDALATTLHDKMEPAMLLASQAKQFLLFTWLKAHAYDMHKMLNEDYETPCEVITGDMPADKRKSVVDYAAAKGYGVVATLDSMGVGINAQALGTTGIFHALDYVPEKMLQAEARLHRLGTKAGVTWTYLAMKESMDELVIKTVINKLDQKISVMGDGKEARDAFGDSDAPDVEARALQELYDAL